MVKCESNYDHDEKFSNGQSGQHTSTFGLCDRGESLRTSWKRHCETNLQIHHQTNKGGEEFVDGPLQETLKEEAVWRKEGLHVPESEIASGGGRAAEGTRMRWSSFLKLVDLILNF